jgi:hydroxymethylpyrimidine pyrophosphatase-like HAD family hydrolase
MTTSVAHHIATIDDQPNDVLMFERSGFSMAMGNASDEVKMRADATTASCVAASWMWRWMCVSEAQISGVTSPWN